VAMSDENSESWEEKEEEEEEDILPWFLSSVGKSRLALPGVRLGGRLSAVAFMVLAGGRLAFLALTAVELELKASRPFLKLLNASMMTGVLKMGGTRWRYDSGPGGRRGSGGCGRSGKTNEKEV
jgi:hypothetical protein